jgi:putative membrane protein
MSYLDDPRVLFAAERTLLAWQRSFSLWLGVGLLLLGALMSVVSALQFLTVLRGLGEQEIPRGYWTVPGVWLNFVLAAVALALAINFVWTA